MDASVPPGAEGHVVYRELTSEEAKGESGPGKRVSKEELQVVARAYTRLARDELLKATDHLVLPDAPIAEGQQEAWVEYRQALRDLPTSSEVPSPPAELPGLERQLANLEAATEGL